MKKALKHWGVLLVAIALVAVAGKFTFDHHLKAADEEGTLTAENEQLQAMQAQATVEVVIPSAPAQEVPPAGPEPVTETPVQPEPAAEIPAGPEPVPETPVQPEPAAEIPAEPEHMPEVPVEAQPAEDPTAEVIVAEPVTQQPEATAEPHVSLYAFVNGGNSGFYYGDTVELRAGIVGEEYLSRYTITWEYNDGENWFSTGVTGDSYIFTVNTVNAGYGYRATMTYEL